MLIRCAESSSMATSFFKKSLYQLVVNRVKVLNEILKCKFFVTNELKELQLL